MKEEIERLKQKIFSQDWQEAQIAVDRLSKVEGENILDFFTALSKVKDSKLRSLASLALIKIRENEEVTLLKRAVLAEVWDKVRKAFDRLQAIGGEKVFQFLISLLDQEFGGIRNCSAMILREMKDSRAVDPLLVAINKEENKLDVGTRVYALETLDCSQKVKEIFDILFYRRYLAKISAFNILEEQIIEFTEEDVWSIKAKWEECKKNPESCPDFVACKADIEMFVEAFMGYLKEE
jgi:hypothetical protein